jgi:hypothetical protein
MYKAIFTMPAVVRFEVLVEKGDMTEALASAFDKALAVGPADINKFIPEGVLVPGASRASIMVVNSDLADNQSIERVDVTDVQTPTPSQGTHVVSLEADNRYVLELFESDLPLSTEPMETFMKASYAKSTEAVEKLKEVLSPEVGPIGSGRVVDTATSYVIAEMRCARGGWEVRGSDANGNDEAFHESWLSKEKALQVAKALLKNRHDIVEIIINDFTCRKAGPLPVRRIA